MKTKFIALVLLVVLILLISYAYKLQQDPATTNPIESTPITEEEVTPSIDTTFDLNNTNFTGILRFSGFTLEQKAELQLQDANYILEVAPFSIDDMNFNVLVLEGHSIKDNQPVTSLEGKCVSANGAIDPASSNGNYNGAYLYGLLLRDATLDLAPLESCRNVIYTSQKPSGPNIKEDEFKSVEIKGVIKRINRPSPDIGYDYVIDSKEPIPGAMNASGLGEPLNSAVVFPANFDVYSQLEQTIGTQVHVKGYFQWGYAESQFFTIEEFVN